MARRRIGQERFGFMGRDRGGSAAPEELGGAIFSGLVFGAVAG